MPISPPLNLTLFRYEHKEEWRLQKQYAEFQIIGIQYFRKTFEKF